MRSRSTFFLPPDRWLCSAGGARVLALWGTLALGGLVPLGASALAVPLPTPRPDMEADTESPQQAREPEDHAAAPALALPRGPGMVSGRRVAVVPLPAPRPVELYDEDDEAAADTVPDEARVAPLLIPPPPPSGSAVGRPLNGPRAPAVEVVASEDLPAQCASLVEQQAMMAVRVAPIDGKGACGLSVAVKLSAVRLQDGSLVPLRPAAVLACETAAAITTWMREDIAPAVAGLGTHMEAIKVAASYDCRTRNRIRGAQISEHGRGNAMDVGGFVLAGGQVAEVKNNGLPLPLQVAMKNSACERFGTVLGPGSDGYHEDHVHVDVAKRRLDVKLCRWAIKGPAPAKEPLVAGPAAADPVQEGEAQEPASKEMAEAGVPLPTRRPPLPTDKPGRARGG